MKYFKHHAVSQFISAIVSAMLFAGGCLGAAIIIFGHFPRMGNMLISKLANIEVSQLVGTTDYTNKANNDSSMVKAISSILHLPFTDPLTMLTSQLPETNEQIVQQQSTNQSSLFAPIASWKETSNSIALGWMMSNSTSGCINMLQHSPGINVAAPTWFHLNDASGNIVGNTLPNVVSYAHQHNIKVWAVMDNQVNGQWSSNTAHQVLQNPKARMNMVDELAYQCKLNHLDGINVDFEGIYDSDRDAFTAFIKELHERFSAENLNVSVDISPDITTLDDNKAFFHAGLAEYADEVVLMAYDEHWGNDPIPGPVADIPWVEQSVNDLLDTGVPTDKLVLAMPFYTQFWYVHKNGQVRSTAYSVSSVNDILAAHNATGSWNPQKDLMYARYPVPDGYMEVWYPTKQTFTDELSVVNSDGLAGIGVWSLDWSAQSMWSSIINNLLGPKST